MSYLLSKPDNWKVRVDDLINQSEDGKASVRAGVDELIKFGYIRRSQAHAETGKFAESNYEVFEQPLTENRYTVEPPHTDLPHTEKPHTENRTLNNNELNKKESTKLLRLKPAAKNKIPTETDIIKIFCEVTGMVVMPASEDRSDHINAIACMISNYGYDEAKQRMVDAYSGWQTKKTLDGRPYSRTNLAWINYAVAGETLQEKQSIPQPKSNGSKSKREAIVENNRAVADRFLAEHPEYADE
jgi:hypothetical protein